jgi:C1A family cysteine protease
MGKVKIDKSLNRTFDQVLNDQEIRSRLKFGDTRGLDRMDSLETPASASIIEPLTDRKGMGWLHELPDFRDYNIHTEMDEVTPARKAKGVRKSVKTMAAELGIPKAKALPPNVDLTAWFSPVEDQGSIGSCTANAGVALLEYFEKRAFNNYIDASRLFLYKTTRNLMNWSGDTGAYLRTTMEALTLFGVCPEKYFPYRVRSFDAEPTAFCYSFAQNYQSISYFRHDPPGTEPEQLLQSLKKWLATGVPAMFGFTCYSSLDQANADGKIPFPTKGEKDAGGHAMVVAGYDNDMIIQNRTDGSTTKGAFLIRNSWGTTWGRKGYGWLPYEYVLRGLAVDWWSLLKAEWVDTKQFHVE